MTDGSTSGESRGSGPREDERTDDERPAGDEGGGTAKEGPWYESTRGDALVTVLALLTTAGAALSVGWGQSSVVVPPIRTTAPVDIYLYGFLGAITRAIATFVTDLEKLPGIGPSPEGREGDGNEARGRTRDGEPNDGRTGAGDGTSEASEEPTAGGGGSTETAEAADGAPSRIVVEGISSKDVKRMALRIFAALCLAVGLFLTSDLAVQTFRYVDRPADPLMAGLAFIAGFYVDETYVVLGTIADRVLEPLSDEVIERQRRGRLVVGKPESRTTGRTGGTGDDRTEVERHLETGEDDPANRASGETAPGRDEGDTASATDEGDRRWSESVLARLLVAVGVGLTTVAVLLSIEWGGPDAPYPPFVPVSPAVFPANRVPFDIYLYAFLGSMGYVFTSLFNEYERTLGSFSQHALRAPVGPLLAAALFLLSALVLGITTARTAQFYAGVAFLVGLYTNVALLTFDVVAARLFGVISGGSGGGSRK